MDLLRVRGWGLGLRRGGWGRCCWRRPFFEGHRFSGVGFALCAGLVVAVVGVRWILLLAEATFFDELEEVALCCRQLLVLLGEADSVLAKAAVLIFRERWICC